MPSFANIIMETGELISRRWIKLAGVGCGFSNLGVKGRFYYLNPIGYLMRQGSAGYFFDKIIDRMSDEENPDTLVNNITILVCVIILASAFFVMLFRGLLTDFLVTQILLLVIGILLGTFIDRRSSKNAK